MRAVVVGEDGELGDDLIGDIGTPLVITPPVPRPPDADVESTTTEPARERPPNITPPTEDAEPDDESEGDSPSDDDVPEGDATEEPVGALVIERDPPAEN